MPARPYQRITNNGDLNSPVFRNRLVKSLFALTLIAIIMMGLGSLIYPQSRWHSAPNVNDEDNMEPVQSPLKPESQFEAQDDESDGDMGFLGVKTPDICKLPDVLRIFKSEDGTYTPPPPDPSLLAAIHKASPEDYESYCRTIWDPDHGFTDANPYNENGECGNWQEKYKALHTKRLQQLERVQAHDYSDFTGKENPGYIAYICREVAASGNRGCGGMADRMSGMVSTFMFALLTDRAYLAHWMGSNPVPLETLFEAPNIQWSYDPEKMRQLFRGQKQVSFQEVDTLNKNYEDMGLFMFPDGQHTDFNALFTGTFIEVRSNRGYIVRTFQESDMYAAILNKMGLNKVNAFGCLVDYLFQPTVGSRRFRNAFRHVFQMKSILSIGMQIRSNDTALANPELDTTTLEEWDHFITCANQLASVKRKPHHTQVVYFMVTDSIKLRNEFLSLNSDPVKAKKFFGAGYAHTTAVATGLPVDHIEPDQVKKYINVTHEIEVTTERMTPGVNSAIIENWLLGDTDYRIISPQGYGKLAAFHSRSDTTTISLPRASRKEKSPNCAYPTAFTSYDYLSRQWSLG